jgi:hypothetical protein
MFCVKSDSAYEFGHAEPPNHLRAPVPRQFHTPQTILATEYLSVRVFIAENVAVHAFLLAEAASAKGLGMKKDSIYVKCIQMATYLAFDTPRK